MIMIMITITDSERHPQALRPLQLGGRVRIARLGSPAPDAIGVGLHDVFSIRESTAKIYSYTPIS